MTSEMDERIIIIGLRSDYQLISLTYYPTDQAVSTTSWADKASLGISCEIYFKISSETSFQTPFYISSEIFFYICYFKLTNWGGQTDQFNCVI